MKSFAMALATILLGLLILVSLAAALTELIYRVATWVIRAFRGEDPEA